MPTTPLPRCTPAARSRCASAELGVPEPQRRPGGDGDTVLVHPGGEPDQPGEADAGDGDGMSLAAAERGNDSQCGVCVAQPCDRCQQPIVSPFRIAAEPGE